jgi:signal transduction histidine kinase
MARSRAGVYGISLAAAVAAILVRWFLDPWLGVQQPYSIVYAAVALAVWLGGYRPAGLAALFAYLPATWLYVEPRHVLGHEQPARVLGFVLYLATCGIVIAFGEATRRASQRAVVAREEAQRHSGTAAESDQRLASELQAMSHLHALSSRLMSATDLNAALEDILDNAIATCGADFGNIQLSNETSGMLEIAVQRGFGREFLEHFRAVAAEDDSVCARALRHSATCAVEDVERDPDFAPHRAIAAAAGFRAVQSTPLVTRDGAILGMLSTHFRASHRLPERNRRFLDLHARLAADLVDRLRYERMLRQADRSKDEFLATLAHELRNPLAPIRNAVHVFKAQAPDDPALTWCREVIERQLGQMARLLDDLLDVSRITANKFDLRKATVPLAPVIAGAVETSRPLIEEVRHDLTVEVPEEPIYVEADPVRLGQVFSNLLNNAARYTPEGGSIRLACERRGEEVVVSVRDTGIGIGPDMLPRVFDMFSQAEVTTDGPRRGLGIGLSLAKGLVEMHGGHVEAKSAGHRQGSEFLVRLPVAQEAPRPGADGSAEPSVASRGPKRRLLVVDDLKDNADSLAMLLGMMGHEVHVAYDGETGVEAAERHRPEVVLLDIGMPKLNGYDACRRIRQQPWGRGMHIVAITGWGQEHDRRRGEEAGFEDHMVKPVDPAALLKMLESFPR